MRPLAQIRNVAVAMVMTGAPLQALAQGAVDPDKSVDVQIKQMQKELDALRRDNQAMKSQIDDLKSRTEDTWLTETRASEIRGLVQDVLADADNRASLLQNGASAGWDEHFFLGSADGRFLLILEGQLQTRWILNYHHFDNRAFIQPGQGNDLRDYRSGFEVARARLAFRGHVFSPDLEYMIRGDFFGARPGGLGFEFLLDAWVRYHLTDEWSVRAGQFKLPYNREELVSSADQLAVERSLVNEVLNIGRSQGIELSYHDDDNALSVAYDDGETSASFGSPQINTPWSAVGTDYAFAGRYERKVAGTWEQFDDFTSPRGEEFGLLAGVAGFIQRSENTGFGSFGVHNEQTALGATGDLSVEWGGANAFGSFMYEYIDNAPGQVIQYFGFVVQGGVYVAPKWEVFARGEYGWIDVDPSPNDLAVITGGFNYYIDGQDVKWTTDLGWSFNPMSPLWVSNLAGYRSDFTAASFFTPSIEAERPQVVFRTQIQILF